MSRKNLDLFLTMGIALANMLWIVIPYHPLLIGTVLALPLVFLLPGYTLTQALLQIKMCKPTEEEHTTNGADAALQVPLEPRDTVQSIEAPQMLLFSLGLSLAMDVLSGFLLNFLPMGLQASSWAIFLGSLTLLLSLLTLYLRYKHPRQTMERVVEEGFTFHWLPDLRSVLLLGSAMLIVVLSLWYAVWGAMEQPHPDFTQFWLLPAKQAKNGCAVQLGIQSFEAVPRRYAIRLTMNGKQITTGSPPSLAPSQQWEEILPIPPGTAKHVRIEAILYRLDRPKTAYRTVSLNRSCSV